MNATYLFGIYAGTGTLYLESPIPRWTVYKIYTTADSPSVEANAVTEIIVSLLSENIAQ
jgi:hypothetical protein